MSKQRAKGTAAETAVVNYLKANGFPDADRSPLRGVLDKGDVTGIRNVVIEIKNHRTYAIPAWLRELEVEATNAQASKAFLVVKPNGVGASRVGDWWAVLPLWRMAELLRGR
ncbi:MAG: hypothetical protein EBT04_11705 [Betaproteobacteria bacterium]|nr:hypothetical protein [Betaproteobacteria bacterium]